MRAFVGVMSVFAVSAILVVGPAAAEPFSPFATPVFSTLGTRDGLPNASVSGIAQDAQGFLWFGTQGGLARYDGYSFKLFGHVPFDAASLPHDQVQSIFMDGDVLWVGTYGGLGRLDLKTERFTSFAKDSAREDSLSNDVVTCMARDADGALWVGTLSGLNRLDEATGRFRRFRHDAANTGSLPADVVRALKVDRAGRLWVGTSGGGLALYDKASGSFRAYRKGGAGSIISDHVMALDLDPSGRLWVGTWFGGLSLFDPATGRFENHPTADERVYSLCAAEDGVLYVGTWGGGLFEYDTASGIFSRQRASASSGSLSHDVVYSLLRDSSGELWIGTNGGGVCKIGGGNGSFEVITAGPGGMPSGKVYSLLVDRLGYLWAGVYNEGIARRDPVTGAWRRYRREAGNQRSLPNDIVNFLHEDQGGDVWAGTNDGLARFDRTRDSFTVFHPMPGKADSLSSEIMFAMADAPGGGAWIGTFSSGLEFMADRRSGPPGSFAHLAYDATKDSSLSDNLVNTLGHDDQGKLWVGTNRGLDRLEGVEATRFIRYLYDPSKPGGVSSNSIRTMFLDSRKVLWFGTAGGGLMRREPETDSFVSYTKRDGLPSNTVLRLLEDASGNIWVSTQAGIAVYDPTNGRFRVLSIFSESRSAEFFSGAFRASDGSLYFGALDRVYRFHPERHVFNDHRPPVALCSIVAKGMPPIGAAAASRLERLNLPWRSNSITFDFAALDYRDPARNLYSFRLEGFDAGWSPSGTGHAATYTNLPGGRYVFRVRAANNDGLWNEEGLSLPIKVGFAPWASPWAYLLYVVLLAGGGFALAYFPVRASLGAARGEADSLLAQLVEASASLESASMVDALTGLPNRWKLEEQMELAFSRALSMRLDLAVIMVDIDNFKAYNDRFGRAAGDECLRRVAGALSVGVRHPSDFHGRFGGEEFLVVLADSGIEAALAEGEALRRSVEMLAIPCGGSGDSRPDPVVTVSVGCASIQPDGGNTLAFLVEAAEKALMAAKQRGRNRTSS